MIFTIHFGGFPLFLVQHPYYRYICGKHKQNFIRPVSCVATQPNLCSNRLEKRINHGGHELTFTLW